jgi:hypothetical protein
MRLEGEGLVYHVIARGNERRAIFRDDRDRERYLVGLVRSRNEKRSQRKEGPMNRDKRNRVFVVSVVTLVSLVVGSAAVLAEDRHRDADTFSQVVRALHGRDCPVISDAAGNAGSNPLDFTRLFIGNDHQNVYFLVEVAGDASANNLSVIHLDTDMDQTTGCLLGIPRLNGSEYGVFLLPTGSFVGNLTGCAAGSDDFPNGGGIRTATNGHFIAAIVPISTLQILTPGVQGFLVWFDGGGNFGPGVYMFR